MIQVKQKISEESNKNDQSAKAAIILKKATQQLQQEMLAHFILKRRMTCKNMTEIWEIMNTKRRMDLDPSLMKTREYQKKILRTIFKTSTVVDM